MTEKDYAETLFQAMNVLIDKKIETVKFDETIVATIVDASKAESGQYIVSTGNAKFIAYSTETRYKENTAVMVTIPQGNYDNQKMIIGKAIDNANTPMIYKSPLQSLINVSNNLISKDVGVTSFWANSEDAYLGRYWNIGQNSFKDATVYIGDESEEPSITYIWDSGEILEQGFTRLGLQAQFSTWLNEYDTITGNYGLAVELTFKCLDLEENNTFTNIFTFDSNEFFGDVYNFETYYTQENLYDISDFKDYPIVRIRLFPYQRGNFKDTLGEFIPTIDTDDFSTIGPNIFIKDPYICLGMSIEDFSGDSVTLITDSSLTYYKKIKGNEKTKDRDKANTKIIGARWIHKDLDTDVITTVQENEIPIGYEVRWYRYKLGAHSPDQFAGAHWERFYGSGTENDLNETTWEYALSEENDIATNSLEVIFIPNINNQTEQIKVIIIKNESATIQKLVASSDILTFTNTDDVRNEATLIDANALSIRFEDDEKGNYFLYNRAGDIGKEEYGEVRVLTAVFDEQEHNINKKALLDITECSEVIWTFPEQNANTMIVPMDDIGPNAQAKKADINGQFIFNNVQQVGYTIKRHLNNNANQNTIRLDIIKDGLRYSAQVQMLFGTAGTSGSDYTVFIEWEDGQNAFIQEKNLTNTNNSIQYKPLKGIVHLMDQSGQLINIPQESDIILDWYQVSPTTNGQKNRLKEENLDFKYPISSVCSLLKSNQVSSSLQSDFNNDFSIDSSVMRFNFNLTTGKFDQNNSGKYGITNNLKEKIVFKQIDIVDTESNVNGIYLTKNSNTKKIIYHWNSNYRVFIKYKDVYIIDPWDHYEEAETYYYPSYSTEYSYNESSYLKIDKVYDENDNSLIIPNKFTINHNDTNPNLDPSGTLHILRVTIDNFGDYQLVALFPIPIKYQVVKDDQVIFISDYIEGPTSVRYATTGETDFNKNSFEIVARLFEDNNFTIKKSEDLTGYWQLIYEDISNTEDMANFLPSLVESRLDENTNEYKRFSSFYKSEHFSNYPSLNPLGVYFSDAPLYGVKFVLESSIVDADNNEIIPADTILWTQPILVYQDNYPSTTLNKWNGKDIITDNDTGVIVANGLSAGKKESDNTFTGVIMGDWSRTDTDKFITKQTGVYGFNHGAMSYALKDDGTAFFGKDGSGRIYFNGNKAQIYSAHWIADISEKNGMLIDVDDGYIKMIGTNKTKITLSSSSQTSSYFQISVNNNGQDKPLIDIGSSSYYLQSKDYSNSSGSEAGIRFDLGAGKLTGYDFNIYAKYTGNENNLPEYDSYTYTDGSVTSKRKRKYSEEVVYTIQINSGDSIYPLKVGGSAFTVSWNGVVTAHGGSFNDLTASGANISNAYISNIDANNIYAKSGDIGGWSIDTSSLSGGNTTLSSSNGITTNAITVTGCGRIGNYDNSGDHLGIQAINGNNSTGGYVACYASGKVSIGDSLQVGGAISGTSLYVGKGNNNSVTCGPIYCTNLQIGDESLYEYILRITGNT